MADHLIRSCLIEQCQACARVREGNRRRDMRRMLKNPKGTAEHYARLRGLHLTELDYDRWQLVPEPIREAWYARGFRIPFTPAQLDMLEPILSTAPVQEVVDAIRNAPLRLTAAGVVNDILGVERKVKAIAAETQRIEATPVKAWELAPASVPLAVLMNNPELMKYLGRTS